MYPALRQDRRRFIAATGSAFAALAASGFLRLDRALAATPGAEGYGALVADAQGVLDLPPGFSYRIVSQLGDMMDDGFTVPDHADGMGCFDLGNGRIALVRNHELLPGLDGGGVTGPAFDTTARSLVPLPGGTTTIVLDAETLAVERQHRSLAGTIRNCAGGITPWGSWLSCEENVQRADGRTANKDHGWVFEVPANAPGLVDPVPLKAMGRFYHEAACVDPLTGTVYMTEDREDGLLYRFVPKIPGLLGDGGRLEALALEGIADTRNWHEISIAAGEPHVARWIALTDVESPEEDLRYRGAAAGASLFARGEGIWMGKGELYAACTSGGAAKQGQVFRLKLGGRISRDRAELFFESNSPDTFSFGDNLTIAPDGHLIVCEDQYTDIVTNHLRGLTPDGQPYAFGFLHDQTEFAGACFAPDGATLFVNLYSPARTLAIRGPWKWL